MGVLALALAAIGGILALLNEANRYHRTATVDWGHVALAFGVPALTYVIIRAAGKRPSA